MTNFLANIFSSGIGEVFTGIGSLAKDIRSAITGEPSPEKVAEIQQKLVELEYAAANAQTSINLQEAKHPNIFVSGWRPFIGWVCGLALLYNFIINPMIIWISQAFFTALIPPVLDISSLMTLVLSLLGLGGMRSYEKARQVNGRH